jgi:hypothetical protein
MVVYDGRGVTYYSAYVSVSTVWPIHGRDINVSPMDHPELNKE